MTDDYASLPKPSERLMQSWIYQETWSLREAVLLAQAIEPGGGDEEAALAKKAALVKRAGRDGVALASPEDWLWWGEKNGLRFHTDWWVAVSPQGPIGYDGEHFAYSRPEMLSDAYLQQERRLITKWARKPYWTPREAIDLSLNFDPFTTEDWRGEEPENGATIREREDRFTMLKRAVEAGHISEKASPEKYILWLDNCGYIISEAWRRALGIKGRHLKSLGADPLNVLRLENEKLKQQLKEKSEQIAKMTKIAPRDELSQDSAKEIQKLKATIRRLSEGPANPSEKGALARRTAALEKALLAAAVDGLSFDPRKTKSDVAQQIAAKSDELGCSVTAQTIRKYLLESADLHVEPQVWTAIYS